MKFPTGEEPLLYGIVASPASYCDCYLTETWSAWSWSWLAIETTFILLHVKVKLFWFTVYQNFTICLPLFCGRPEVLQGYALPYPGVTHAGL